MFPGSVLKSFPGGVFLTACVALELRGRNADDGLECDGEIAPRLEPDAPGHIFDGVAAIVLLIEQTFARLLDAGLGEKCLEVFPELVVDHLRHPLVGMTHGVGKLLESEFGIGEEAGVGKDVGHAPEDLLLGVFGDL